MALALFLFILGAALVGLVLGKLYFLVVGKGLASTKASRRIGVLLLVGMSLAIWTRLLWGRGRSPRLFQLSSQAEYTVSLAVALLVVAIVTVQLARIIRMRVLERRRDVRRVLTVAEILRRDEEGESTLAGQTFQDIEVIVGEACQAHLGTSHRVGFEFLDPLAIPMVAGWIKPIIRCPLDMASGEAGDYLELAALREAELLARGLIRWRIFCLVMLVVNPFGAWFARGILLSLELEADAATAGFGDGAVEVLRDLIAYQIQHAGSRKGQGILEIGSLGLEFRLARVGSALGGSAAIPALAATCILGLLGSGAVALGPVGLTDVYGIVRLRPPIYMAAESPQTGLVVQKVPGEGVDELTLEGFTGDAKHRRDLRDGFLADARHSGPGLATLWFYPQMIGFPTVRVHIQSVPGASHSSSPPLLYINMLSVHRSEMWVYDYTVSWSRITPLPAGGHEITIPLESHGQFADAGIYLPQGWAIRVTDLKPEPEMELAQEAEETKRNVLGMANYEAMWRSDKMSLSESLDWSPANISARANK